MCMYVCVLVGAHVSTGAHKPRTQSPVLFLKKPPPLFSKTGSLIGLELPD